MSLEGDKSRRPVRPEKMMKVGKPESMEKKPEKPEKVEKEKKPAPAEAAGPLLTLPPENDKTVYRATGRRKTAVARVMIKRGAGAFVVNGKEAEAYFQGEMDRFSIKSPLRATKALGAFDVRVNIQGGGTAGQAGAVLLGVARALKRAVGGADPVLRAEGMLTRDPREKERRKYGRRKARRGFQWTKR